MHIIMKGISHKTAPLWFREKFSFSKKGMQKKFSILREQASVEGGVIISTCNRVEIYAVVDDLSRTVRAMDKVLYSDVCGDIVQNNYFYSYIEREAVTHLFRVASGIDSQVLGETQIMKQLRFAWEEAQEFEVSCAAIDKLFRTALITARRSHAKTAISKGNASVCSVAMRKCHKELGSLRESSVLIIGAGKVACLMAKYLKKQNMHAIFVSNRTYNRALSFAQTCNAEVVHFDELYKKMHDIDIVIASTSAPHTTIHYNKVKEVMEKRKSPLFMIDLGVPRDIDERIRDIRGVGLYDLDDLKSVVEENYALRENEIYKVEKIIKWHCDKFFESFKKKVRI